MGSNSALVNVIMPLKNIIKVCQLTKFDIAATNDQEKKPINEEIDHKKANNNGLQQKIKVLLD